MFFYARKADTGADWDGFKDSQRAEVERTYRHWSVYLQHQQHHEGLDYTKVRLKGDLQIDIDYKDLGVAIAQTNKLLDYFEQIKLDLNYIKLYLSGGKGFHITIPQRVFGDDKAMTLLNKYHSWMMSYIGTLTGVTFDMGLYHKRHLIRIPGSQRMDGTWKVPVTPEEVRSLTVLRYKELTQSPRTLPVSHMVPPNYFCEKLGELWAKAQDEAKKQASKKYHMVAATELDVFNDSTLPQCIEWMRDHTSVKGNFNEVSMQFGSFIAHAANISDKVKDRLLQDFATNTPSDSRPTLNAKLHHVNTALRAAQGGSLDFSCGGCRSVLSGDPCSGCPVKASQEQSAAESTSIEAGEDGYYLVGGKGQGRRFTTFLMNRSHRVCSMENDNPLFHADVFEVTEKVSGNDVVSTVTIPAEDWTSMSAFKRKIAQVAGAVVIFGSDNELANLHNYLNTTQVGEILLKVEQAGIHVVKTLDKEQRFWAEEDWSLDTGGTSGQHTYEGVAGSTVLTLRGVDSAKPEDAVVVDILDKLMSSNRPESVGMMLGWASGCHLKEHLHKAGFYDFPLLHIAGKPGAGKTGTATVYSTLTGGFLPGGPMAVDVTTALPLKQAVTQTTTIARVFDEFNRPNMQYGKYLNVLAILKAVYCRQNMAMGYVGKSKIGSVGAATKDMLATSPVIYMSREATENEELIQRSIIIRINEEDHKLENYEANFLDVYRSLSVKSRDGHPLQKVTKLLVKSAIETPVEQVQRWYEEAQDELPLNEHTRRVQNLFAIRMGLKFLAKALENFPTHLTDKLSELDRIVVSSWRSEEASMNETRRRWSTTETLVQTLHTMAVLPASDSTPGKISPGHYVRRGSTVYINCEMVFPAYRMHTKALGLIAEVGSPTAMLELLKSAKYCLGVGGTPEMPAAHGWVALDLSQLQERGIYGEGFSEE